MAWDVYAGWTGLFLLSLLFLANALGTVDPARAVHDLESAGLPGPLSRRARILVGAGRLLQLVAAPALFFGETRAIAALALGAFVALATPAAHPFWRSTAKERDLQLANFLKNVALIGGLLVAAGWRAQS